MQKLVRDQIPKIIENTGRRCNVRVLDETEYYLELKKSWLRKSMSFLPKQTLRNWQISLKLSMH